MSDLIRHFDGYLPKPVFTPTTTTKLDSEQDVEQDYEKIEEPVQVVQISEASKKRKLDFLEASLFGGLVGDLDTEEEKFVLMATLKERRDLNNDIMQCYLILFLCWL